MTASVLARKAGVPVHTVRHYTRIGLLKPSRDLRNGYKLYKPADKQRLRFVTSAKELGFTLAEIEEILGHAEHGDSPCPMVRDIVQKRVDENKQKIRDQNCCKRDWRARSVCGNRLTTPRRPAIPFAYLSNHLPRMRSRLDLTAAHRL